MKLPEYQETLQANLAEFDIWITPSLGEIRDTNGFKEVLDRLIEGFEAISLVTDDFSTEASCRPQQMGAALQKVFSQLPVDAAKEFLSRVISVIYLVTGKSDNNAKCQFPLFLRNHLGISHIPSATRSGKLSFVSTPRVLGEDRLITVISSLRGHTDHQALLFQHFIEFILSDEKYVSQLWSVGHSYANLRKVGRSADLLSPLAIFQVRGSVSAKGGHTPERILRQRLTDWGLRSGLDFNENDIILHHLPVEVEQLEKALKQKTRAYDFAIPVTAKEHGRRLLVQSQFYAGDSGSVSHKNVDQVGKSRAATSLIFPESTFIEYVDGAGYFASLNGDLRSLLSMKDTASFFQIRSAPIRLRRELQRLGHLTTLEVEHAILSVGQNVASIYEHLAGEGYDYSEIRGCISQSVERSILLQPHDSQLAIQPERRDLVRRYFLLDMAAIFGNPLADDEITGSVLIPGYGPFYGLKQNELIRATSQASDLVKEDWRDGSVPFDDLQWLLDRNQGFIMAGR